MNIHQINRCSMHHSNTKIRQPMAMLYNKNRLQNIAFFLLRMSINTCKKEKINYHTAVSKTTLVLLTILTHIWNAIYKGPVD